jgi:hypothetical protein
MARRSTVGLLACLLAVGAVLGGCSETQKADDTLPSASAAAPTEEELPPLGPADLPMPEEARTQDSAGAEAFVRYYIELLNQSLTDMDPQYLRFFSEAVCDACRRIASETESDAAAGYSYSGGELTIPGDISVMLSSPGEAQTAFVADQAPMTVLDSAGTPVPDLVFEGIDALNSGTIAVWDDASSTWKLTELTLG